MFLPVNFIQEKFIYGMDGKRFTFEDKIVMDIFNQTQDLILLPSIDSLLKVRLKEAYGVDARMDLTDSSGRQLAKSEQIGTNEILVAKVKRGDKLVLRIDYRNSIIQLPNYFTCPHIEFHLSMVSIEEAKTLAKQLECSKEDERKTETALDSTFQAIGEKSMFYTQPDELTKAYCYQADQANSYWKKQNIQITSRKFTLFSPKQVLFELHYEPYFYDLELTLVSLEVENTRKAISLKSSISDWTMLKGAKRLLVDLEPGAY